MVQFLSIEPLLNRFFFLLCLKQPTFAAGNVSKTTNSNDNEEKKQF